ncbi:MAG: hypothetical protein V1706_06605 [Pseudomonadota bacterium]
MTSQKTLFLYDKIYHNVVPFCIKKDYFYQYKFCSLLGIQYAKPAPAPDAISNFSQLSEKINYYGILQDIDLKIHDKHGKKWVKQPFQE